MKHLLSEYGLTWILSSCESSMSIGSYAPNIMERTISIHKTVEITFDESLYQFLNWVVQPCLFSHHIFGAVPDAQAISAITGWRSVRRGACDGGLVRTRAAPPAGRGRVTPAACTSATEAPGLRCAFCCR